MKTTLRFLILTLLLLQHGHADNKEVTSPTAGQWEGSAKTIMTWCQQKTLSIKLAITPGGKVTGTIGDATLINGRLKPSRTWLGRALGVKTDFIIVGDLQGPIIAAENILRKGINMPLNFDGKQFTGGLHTSGSTFGGKKRMKLSATSLTLTASRSRPPL